ncbi:disease resistance protein RGA2-like isoform X1 [Canna indica]|uniref:Disease resistance protein RGA2-like isoform X1 n=1 Tax=Canna indica TaxID=4628 RepID=A0AAQ3L218_9LILI|nr:disease resistance protein RGA2-like isoform X1 [Canna indica]
MMAEWFASALINKLVDKLCSCIGNRYEHHFTDAEDKLIKKLKGTLVMIQSAIHVAEDRQIKNPTLAYTLRELKKAAYDLDDILDKFDYKVLQDKILNPNQVRGHDFASSSSGSAKRACIEFTRVIFSDEDSTELAETAKRFDNILHDISLFIKFVELDVDASKQEETLEWQYTTSISVRSDVFGRDGEIKNLIDLLLKPSNAALTPNSKNFSLVSILGIGGVGKTTIAQAAYNDESIANHFDVRAWVCVSAKFDVKRITVEIIESASIEKPGNFESIYSLDAIQQILKEGLVGKKFLIVLDDVWNEISSKWDTLSKPFLFGNEESRIVITTRCQHIADMMGTKGTVKLEGLAYEECKAFFTKCAFGNEDPLVHPKLLLIGEQIVKKLGGSPLAAKTIGSVLKSNFKEDHWRRILGSKLWQVEQNEDGILAALRLSYQHLPAHLKQCFAYCSLFPKDHCFEKSSLVLMWMALGFIQPDGIRRLEDIGFQYIDDLTKRFFFQIAEEDNHKVKTHDLLHDLSESVFKGEHFRVENNDFSVEIPKGIHHLYVYTTNLLKVYEYACQTENLRSLVLYQECHLPTANFFHVLEETLKKLKGLRVLIVHNFHLNTVPEVIGDFLHLRYLEIQSTNGIQIPESICRLYHLQGLCLQKTNVFSQRKLLLASVKNLINLRHLIIESRSIMEVPGIGQLTSLQELKEFHIRKVKGFQIEELGKLRQLHGQLRITNLENVSSKTDAKNADLHNKEHLKKLSLCWGSRSESDKDAYDDNEILEGLRPHKNVRCLEITFYMGLNSPRWMETSWGSNLETIKLLHCYSWKVLPPFGELPFLRVLHLKYMPSVENIGLEFYGKAVSAFPLLEKLTFENMYKWMHWSEIESGRNLFLSLRKLRIRNCPNLKGPLPLPTLRTQILAVTISDEISPHPANRRLLKQKDSALALIADRILLLFYGLPVASLVFIHRSQIASSLLATFTPEQEKWFQHLTFLRYLTFYGCSGLQSLPANLECLVSLKGLYVKKCPLLKELPENGLPTTLKELHIADCSQELSRRCQWSNGADWHKISHVQIIIIDGRNGKPN